MNIIYKKKCLISFYPCFCNDFPIYFRIEKKDSVDYERVLFIEAIICIFLFTLFTISGCQKEEEQIRFVSGNIEEHKETQGKITLGSKLENPYSVKNMKRAYESLVKKEGLKASTFDSTIITVTDLYIRFLPHSKEEMNLLLPYL